MNNLLNPVSIFQQWFKEETSRSKERIPSTCCLSTIGLNGFPNARFVSLKEIRKDQLIITGPTHSLKGQEIKRNPKVAISFWWDGSGRQVRIQGTANELSADLANKYFNERSVDSRLVSVLSKQGKPVEDFEELEAKYKHQLESITSKDISRPDDWGGWTITPIRIEFLTFRDNRMHYRELFTWNGSAWDCSILQP